MVGDRWWESEATGEASGDAKSIMGGWEMMGCARWLRDLRGDLRLLERARLVFRERFRGYRACSPYIIPAERSRFSRTRGVGERWVAGRKRVAGQEAGSGQIAGGRRAGGTCFR